jgi:hypothetical protein
MMIHCMRVQTLIHSRESGVKMDGSASKNAAGQLQSSMGMLALALAFSVISYAWIL